MLFDSNAVMSKMSVNVTVLMICGTGLCCDIDVVESVVGQVFEHVHEKAGVEAEAASRLQVAMQRGVGGWVWMAVCMSGVFWAIFVFDMMADGYGNTVGAGMVVVPVVELPLVMWCACIVLSVVSDRQGSLRKEEGSGRSGVDQFFQSYHSLSSFKLHLLSYYFEWLLLQFFLLE